MGGPLLAVGDASGADALEHTFVVLSAVSLCLVAPLVLTFVVFKRKFPSYLVLSFLVCSMGLPLFSLFNAFFGVEHLLREGGVACQVQAVGIQFFAAGIVWAWFFLGLNLYTIAVWQVGGAKRLGRVYLVLTWGFSAIQTILPFAFGHTGPAGFWCWIDSGDNHAWELGFFYGEVGLLLAVGVLLWARVLYVIISYSLDPMRAGLHGYLLRHALLVAMFVGVMVVLFTYRLYQIFDDPPFFFQALHVVSLSGQGFITFICFGISKENYNLWKKAALAGARRLRRCCRRTPPVRDPTPWRGDEDTVLLSSDHDPDG